MKTKPTKAILAAIGGTLTALMTALATAQVVLADDALDLTEYGTVVTAGATLVATVYAVWKATNKPVEPTQTTAYRSDRV